MEPGQVYAITIEMQPTSLVFKKGHRIRVDVTSSDFPHFDRNPNTGHEFGMGCGSSNCRTNDLPQCQVPLAHRAAGYSGREIMLKRRMASSGLV